MRARSAILMGALPITAALAGCTPDVLGNAATTYGTGATGSTTAGAGGGAGGAGGDTAGGGAGAGGAATGGPVLRFVALGDGGLGNAAQYKVAGVVKSVCAAAGGCNFALYLGDNVYNSGVSGTSDTLFQTVFEMPYSILPFRFLVALGNHDYGGNGVGFEFWKAQAEVEYTGLSARWTMPARFYQVDIPAQAGPPDGPVASFFALDTTAILWTADEPQRAWLDNALAVATGWKIAFGHHPYISNGKHGNAGKYEGIAGNPVYSGQNIKDFFDSTVCGKVDIYLCGHDHNRQWLVPKCGTEYIVSGTAARITPLVGQGSPTFFETAKNTGFLLAELTDSTFTGTFYDEDGIEEFSRTISK